MHPPPVSALGLSVITILASSACAASATNHSCILRRLVLVSLLKTRPFEVRAFPVWPSGHPALKPIYPLHIAARALFVHHRRPKVSARTCAALGTSFASSVSPFSLAENSEDALFSVVKRRRFREMGVSRARLIQCVPLGRIIVGSRLDPAPKASFLAWPLSAPFHAPAGVWPVRVNLCGQAVQRHICFWAHGA